MHQCSEPSTRRQHRRPFPSDIATPTTPPAGTRTASITPGTVWGDRYNTSVTVTGSGTWTAA
ncbi:hypothetical protein Adi01nite_06360 [Amorphoplanes digitatis]|uniref:Uncharacterized protein n=1 Tax=Actinoplanes digitatis TaxID=1868 RepID=A0A7W7I215_9ACTN|nr:hypothetical protein [Actinoplanes digitatis]GID91224.1 hypothetical protein Adi01nite_06360 [Actinoplanes digitatis]